MQVLQSEYLHQRGRWCIAAKYRPRVVKHYGRDCTRRGAGTAGAFSDAVHLARWHPFESHRCNETIRTLQKKKKPVEATSEVIYVEQGVSEDLLWSQQICVQNSFK